MLRGHDHVQSAGIPFTALKRFLLLSADGADGTMTNEP